MSHLPRAMPAADPPPPLPACAQRVADGLVLRLKVVASARRSALAGALGERLKVRIAAPAQDGRANAAVLALIGAWLGCRRAAIISGASSPEKSVHLPGVSTLSSAQLAAAGLPCARSGKD
jgi:uncharacterized protein (TIGR00251 family)